MNTIYGKVQSPLLILLADDDPDDRDMFDMVLKSLLIPTQLTMIADCDQLMSHLSDKTEKLPSVLFMDFNMPRMNGVECLTDIQKNERLKALPIIIYSMFIQENVATLLYNKGVHYYIKKGDLPTLKKNLYHILNLLIEDNFTQPTREKFLLTLAGSEATKT